MSQATVEFSAKTSRGPHVAMFALGKLAVERSETCGLRSCIALVTPHPSAYGCHLPPLGKAIFKRLPHLWRWGNYRKWRIFQRAYRLSVWNALRGLFKPPARPVVMTSVFGVSRVKKLCYTLLSSREVQVAEKRFHARSGSVFRNGCGFGGI